MSWLGQPSVLHLYCFRLLHRNPLYSVPDFDTSQCALNLSLRAFIRVSFLADAYILQPVDGTPQICACHTMETICLTPTPSKAKRIEHYAITTNIGFLSW